MDGRVRFTRRQTLGRYVSQLLPRATGAGLLFRGQAICSVIVTGSLVNEASSAANGWRCSHYPSASRGLGAINRRLTSPGSAASADGDIYGAGTASALSQKQCLVSEAAPCLRNSSMTQRQCCLRDSAMSQRKFNVSEAVPCLRGSALSQKQFHVSETVPCLRNSTMSQRQYHVSYRDSAMTQRQ